MKHSIYLSIYIFFEALQDLVFFPLILDFPFEWKAILYFLLVTLRQCWLYYVYKRIIDDVQERERLADLSFPRYVTL